MIFNTARGRGTMTAKEQIVELKKQLRTAGAKARKYQRLYEGEVNTANFFSRYR